MKFFPNIEDSLGVGFLTFTFFIFLFLPNGVFSESPPFLRSLGLGDKGVDVFRLQQFLNSDPDTVITLSGVGSPGFETESFGLLTHSAVKKFQKKYASEILFSRQAPTGYAGPKTLRKLNALAGGRRIDSLPPSSGSVTVPEIAETPSQTLLPPSLHSIVQPEVYNVSPNRVKVGDTVTVTGKSFAPTGNTVFLRYAYIEARFDNLLSPDGRTIVFIYEPPKVRTMTKDELLSLPSEIQQQLLNPVRDAGGSVDDLVMPYRNFRNESELAGFLKKEGSSLDELYDYFYVTVENVNGSGTSQTALLWGLRALSFGGNISLRDVFAEPFLVLLKSFTPKAYAATPEGGWNSGIIMYCTCSGGFLTFMVDYSSNGGSGLYFFPPGFRPRVGTGMASAPDLGFYIKKGGICKIYVGKGCIKITANKPQNPWGAAL